MKFVLAGVVAALSWSLALSSSCAAWHTAPPMPTARNYARAASLGNSVYLIGGKPVVAMSHSAAGSTLVERFDANCGTG